MSADPSPRTIADRQLAAYNAHDLEAYLALFAPEATVSDLLDGRRIAAGLAEIRALYAARFADHPALRCEVRARIDLGAVAIDREVVHGLPTGPLELIAIYEVRGGLIRSLRFVRDA